MKIIERMRWAMDKGAKKRGRNPLVAILLSIVVGSAPIVASANVKDSMDNFWAGSLGSANITGPGSFNGQRQGNYTLGNLSMRMPQESSTIASLQLPSVKAGCGGIDIFAGSFSFINSDQLVATAKAVASNAMGYAFQLALSSLCPTCAQKIEALQDQLNKLTQQQLNSCQMAQSLVNGIAGQLSTQMEASCSRFAAHRGIYTDQAAARNGCANNRQSVTNGMNQTDKDQLPVNKNLAWEAAKNNDLLKNDTQLMELVTSLSGTIIYRCTGNNDGDCKVDFIEGIGSDKSVVAALLDGQQIKVHQCDETDKCLNPTRLGKTITLNSTTSMKGRVETMLTSIVNKIIARDTNLTADEKAFLNLAGAPVYKMASVYTAVQGSAARTQMMSYADIIAVDLVYNFVENGVRDVRAGARNLPGMSQAQMDSWLRSVNDLQVQLSNQRVELANKVQAIDAMVARTQAAESVLAARTATRMGTVLSYSSGLQPR